jgi:hypothetical protein
MSDDGAEWILALDAFLSEHPCGDLDGGVDQAPGGYIA